MQAAGEQAIVALEQHRIVFDVRDQCVATAGHDVAEFVQR